MLSPRIQSIDCELLPTSKRKPTSILEYLMNFIRSTLSFNLLAAVVCLIVNHSSYSQPKENETKKEASEHSKPEQTEREFPAHGYNDVNILSEGWIPVTDNYGKRATRFPSDGERKEPLPDVKFELVWYSPFAEDEEFFIPGLHHGQGLYKSEYPSIPLFFERKHNISYDKLLEVSIPDTPYPFYILDGKLSPYFHDGKNDVVWRLNSKDMDTLFARMKSISVSLRKLELVAPGGDVAEFLTIDFSSRNKSPAISTWRGFDGP